MKPGDQKLVDRLRKVAMALPGTTEKISHGEVCFFNGRSFVSVDDHHHGSGHFAIWVRAEPGVQQSFVEASPEHFFVPPYVGTQGWIGIRLDTGLDWAVVARFVEDGWRLAPPLRKKAAPRVRRRG